jgi:hypothetical protein
VRAAIAVTHGAIDSSVRPVDFARRRWGSDEARNVGLVTRAASAPAMTTTTGWAAELAHVTQLFLASLVPVSSAADLLARGVQVRFNGDAAITFPTITQGQATFIGQGKPIPVVNFQTGAGVKLEPHKLALISTLTREMVESGAAETIIRATLIEAAALGLDVALFSANAGTPDAPAGLLSGISPTVASTTTPLSDAMAADLAKLAGIVARVAGSSIVFIAAPEQALAINLHAPQLAYPVLTSSALTAKTVIAIATSALVSGFAPVPEIDASREAELHWDTAPAEIVGSGGAVAAPVGTLYQGDKIGLKMRMPCAWALRASNAIAFINAASW